MTDKLLLNRTDMESLTGVRRPTAQVRWLEHNGFMFAVDASGRPVVAVAEFERRMIGRTAKTPSQLAANSFFTATGSISE